MENNAPVRIDIDEVLKQKLPNKKIPKFLVRYLKKIIHQDEINEFFANNQGLKSFEFIDEAVEGYLKSGADFENLGNLPPKDGRYIFVSNHPLGGLDSLIIGSLLGKTYDGKIKYFANDILMFVTPLKDMFLPVNKGGKGGNARENAKIVDEFFKSDNHLIIFPAGANSRRINGKIQDLPWLKTFVSKAVQYERDVVPIFFDARNSNFFYNLSKIRTFFRLPNIEMLYLVDEMFKQKGNRFRVKIGEKISFSTFDKSKTPLEWAAWVRQKVYEL